MAAIVDDVAAAAESGAFDAEDVHVSRTPLRLDAQGREELGELLERVVADALRIQEQTEQRDGATDSRMLTILQFERPRIGVPERT